MEGFAFGSGRSALSSLGKPLHEGRNKRGEEELFFDHVVYRFADGKLVEVSFEVPSIIELDGNPIEAAASIPFLKQHDSKFREVYGFGIAPSLGLAIDLEHDASWATAFAAGRWDNMK